MKIDWLKHAFAIEPPGKPVPTREQQRVIDRLCQEIARRRMILPAIAFLEMFRPLNNVGAQVLIFFQPFLEVFTDSTGTRHFAEFLEHRGAVDYLSDQLEMLEKNINKKAVE